ncbi:PQQ-dependent sugar dehydrogenase [Pedobacter metabolipauper]|uniref:PQQ-dependent dehydrogenase (S-GDH family) n=1 Tax=Pedobacter metabolipauper TaxID=425513 RepID=A0A4R6T0G3_9SPHI|nr:PQQ-dependent sugar dehydrogenase [Pedobacter metabolipauper]TDQ10970.1 PQQ-dependent dehydrogenase (s-GDH family) [Pedobacter metabolipauper]
MKAFTLSLLALALISTSCKKSKSNGTVDLPNAELKTRVVTSALTLPWEIIYGPDNQLWVTERSGKISRVNPETGVITPLLTISEVVSNGEGGLLGMALNPAFSTNPWVYVVYNYGSTYREKVVRYTYTNGTLNSPFVILDGIPASSIHNGSRLLITADQKLLITTGDASNAPNAQDLNSLSGKILRVNLDGSIPADNPTAGSRVWSFGHRNPQGLVEANGKIYSSEHGPNNDDEVNIIQKGRNYGWPNVEGYCNETNEKGFCTTNNVVEPIVAWTPTIATCGLTYYNSDYIPQWKNSLLLVNLKASKLIQLKLNDAGTQVAESTDFLVNAFGRLRAICQSPEGKIYIATSNGNQDRIIEIAK